MSGPLAGIRIIELAGLGPAPFGTMLLADMGADVVRVDRKPMGSGGDFDKLKAAGGPTDRGRRSIAIDLKNPRGIQTVLRLIEGADALIEGYRPGVAERLGLGPQVCLGRNPRLVYGRMTGWGQSGPLAQAAGHDINYIALSGALHAIGEAGRPPVPPLNLVGDYGGGGMLLAFGMVCALLEARRSGLGQVVDAAMTDGAALLMAQLYGFHAASQWTDRREDNFLDGAAPFYACYECADGGFVSVGAIEPQFFGLLLDTLGLRREDFPQWSKADWPAQKARLAKVFKARNRDDWCALLEGTDTCFAPVLSMAEAPKHRHNMFRGTFVEAAGQVQPAPAPRFDRTPGSISLPPPAIGEHTVAILRQAGFGDDEIEEMLGQEIVGI
ncbi:CaiB/BaiF CoA-transferase family protein [Magnetospirillum sp. 15-1]|uniref:CaiB/BaiF CoA transferase family protein n=1 Tax=Magnetospirillum sp. 15-1 TaxID=1979370 RepID=UPI000BBCCC9B|nr:CaiB/BaiF CoA-transferase family protein [Magnetospirillum sp. 15-1]